MSKLKHLLKAERDVLGPVRVDYYDLFWYDRSGMPPCTGKGIHEIKTGDALPIKKNPYKVPFPLRSEMKRQFDGIKQRGVITPSRSECAAPAILVKNKSMAVPQISILYRFSWIESCDKDTGLSHSRYRG